MRRFEDCLMASGAIPIRNIYALLAYAWNRLDLARESHGGATEGETPVELLARLLSDSLRRILRRGVHREYLEVSEELRMLRGRVDIEHMVARGLRARGSLSCSFDELLFDVPANRVIKATARRLFACRDVPTELAIPLRAAYLLMSDVSAVDLDDEMLRRARPPRGHSEYELALDVCRLIHESVLPDEAGQGYRLRDFTRDDHQMAALFEAFVRNFLKVELPHARVTSPHVTWAGASGSEASLSWLPRMKTDVSVMVGDTQTIVETKFYRTPFQRRFRGESERIRSAHLYQLFAYLKNAQREGTKTAGILLYASVGKDVEASVRLGDLSVAVRTLDLTSSWADLRLALLRLPFASTGDTRSGGVEP